MGMIRVDIKWAIVTVQNGLLHLNFHNSMSKCYYHLSITYEETEVCSVKGMHL